MFFFILGFFLNFLVDLFVARNKGSRENDRVDLAPVGQVSILFEDNVYFDADVQKEIEVF